MADPVTISLTSDQLAVFRRLAEERAAVDRRVSALAEVITLGYYTAAQVQGQSLVVTDAGIVVTLNE